MALPRDAFSAPTRSVVVRFIRFPVNHTPPPCVPQDHFGDNFDDVLDSGQPYYMEDGHIIYDAAPAMASDGDVNGSGNVNGVMMYNTAVSPAADGRINGSSAGSDQLHPLPQSLWSPTTTPTTIVTTVTTHHDSPSSSKLQVIVSSSPSLCVSLCPNKHDTIKNNEI